MRWCLYSGKLASDHCHSVIVVPSIGGQPEPLTLRWSKMHPLHTHQQQKLLTGLHLGLGSQP